MKLSKVLLFIPFLLLVLVTFSCQNGSLEERIDELEEDFQELTVVNNILELRYIINEAKVEDILIRELIEENEIVLLEFENGNTFRISKEILIDYQIDIDAWRVNFSLSDSTSLESFILGELIVNDNNINLNPFNIAPLSAFINVQTPVNGKFIVNVKGQDGENSDIILDSKYYGKEHILEVFGLYANYINSVELVFTNRDGIERLRTTVFISTDALPSGLPDFNIINQYDTYDQNTLILVNYRPTHIPFMVDPHGKIRWYSEGFTKTSKYALQKFKNGNIGFGKSGVGQGSVFEYTMMGELIKEYTFYPEFENAHHDVYEMSNGNFLIAVNKVGIETVEDHIIEMDRNSETINNIWDLREILPMDRYTLRKIGDGSDWFHVNAVIHDERDNTIIVSGQPQGLAKITWDNQLKWILAPHKGWGTEYSDYLLVPEGTPFEWSWGQHAPLILPNGNLLQFDNGYGREFGNATSQYSRIVEYSISENDNNIGGRISQVWQYGKERGEDMFASFISDVDYISKSSTRFIVAGSTAYDHTYIDSLNTFGTPNIDQIETRIIEVDIEKNVIFEMTLSSDDHTGSTYRAEKIIIN